MIDYKGYAISIETDQMPVDPREYDDVFGIIVFDKRFSHLQDTHQRHLFSVVHFAEIHRNYRDLIIYPLEIKNWNGTVAMTLQPQFIPDKSEYPFDQWKSEWNGLIYAKQEKVKEYLWTHEMVHDNAVEELTKLAAYENGEIYCWFFEDEEWGMRCSGGYYDASLAIKEAKEEIDGMINERVEKEWNTMIENQEAYHE